MSNATSDEQDRSDMRRLSAGQDEAIESLINRHGRRLFHYLIRVLQNEAEASDLAAEAFIRIYQNQSSFDPAQRFSTWLYSIATNLARDLQRKRARCPQVSLDNCPDSENHAPAENFPVSTSDPCTHLQNSEDMKAVSRAVAELPEDLRLPLVLAAYEEKTHAEIAAILDCSTKTVEMRIYRARQQLRQTLLRLSSTPVPLTARTKRE